MDIKVVLIVVRNKELGGVAIANHKTGNEIQIMPMEDAARLYRLSQRSGYGVMKGMKHN
jgi:hypothetical protein